MYVFGNDQKSRGCFHSFNIHSLGRGAYIKFADGETIPDSGENDNSSGRSSLSRQLTGDLYRNLSTAARAIRGDFGATPPGVIGLRDTPSRVRTFESSFGRGRTRSTSFSNDPFVITGLQLAQREKVHIVDCFNDKVYTYAFGHDPLASTLSVNMIGFMINSGGTANSRALSRILEAYNNNRVSQSMRYASLFIGSETPMRGFIVGMQSGTADSEHNLQNIVLDLLLVEVQG